MLFLALPLAKPCAVVKARERPMSDAKRRKPGRPKGPCNAAELAQRRTAAWKHGQRASSVLRQTIPPCNAKHCHLEFPCEIRRLKEERGKVPEVCLVKVAVDEAAFKAYRDAMEGDPEALREMTAQSLAGLHQVLGDATVELIGNGGATVEHEILNKDGDVLGTHTRAHPNVDSVVKLAQVLGVTGKDQQVTPKSRGDSDRDDRLIDIAGFMAAKRAAQAEGESDD